ncbi:MAG: hypothetical protein ABI137_11805 [Antricoccus sp.]
MTSLALVLAAGLPADTDKAAPLGLFMILALIVVSIFLGRSMIKHIRKVPKSWDGAASGSEDGPRLGERAAATIDSSEDQESTSRPSYQTPPRLGNPEDYAEKARAKSVQKSRDARKIAARKAALKSRPADSKTRSASDKSRTKRP